MFRACVEASTRRDVRDACHKRTLEIARADRRRQQEERERQLIRERLQQKREQEGRAFDAEHVTASKGWRLLRRGQHTGITVKYHNRGDRRATIAARMRLELQPQAKIERALSEVPAGGVLSFLFKREEIRLADPTKWLVVVQRNGQDVIRAHGQAQHLAAVSEGYAGFVMVDLPQFVGPLDIYLIPPVGGFRYEYRLEPEGSQEDRPEEPATPTVEGR